MAIPVPHGKEGWIGLARIRLARVLVVRIAATIRQLEVKICESGPPNLRPQPHILATAIDRMVKANELIPMRPTRLEHDERETVFYTLPALFPAPATDRMNQLLLVYRIHRTVARTQAYCGDVLEEMVEATFAAAGVQYQYLGRLPEDQQIGSLDGVWELNGQRIGVDAKNVREWVYPSSERVWKLIRKCLVIDAVPFLIAREVAYITHVLCGRMGMLNFEVHRQFFSPIVPAYLLGPIQNKDELGYKDVRTWVPGQPHPHLLTFIETKLPLVLPAAAIQWADQRELLTDFAVNRKLGVGKMGDGERQQIYRDFSQIVFRRLQPEPDRYEDEFGGLDDW